MATWKDPRTNFTVESQVTPDIFNTLGENEIYLNEVKIETHQVQDGAITSTEATERTNITSGEKLKAIVGKIRKWFSDLKALAFKDTVDTEDIESGAITQGKIASNAVTYGKLATGAVVTAKIADEAVTEPKIAPSAVTNSRIADGAITTSKLGDAAVTNEKVATVEAAKVTGLSKVATTGRFSDLTGIPAGVDMTPYAKTADIMSYLNTYKTMYYKSCSKSYDADVFLSDEQASSKGETYFICKMSTGQIIGFPGSGISDLSNYTCSYTVGGTSYNVVVGYSKTSKYINFLCSNTSHYVAYLYGLR